MNDAPTIVRLLRFPQTLRLTKKGKEYSSGIKRSGPLLLSAQHEPVEVTFRVNLPGVSFAGGAKTVTAAEAFGEGEQRDVLVPWELVVADQKVRPASLILEIDVSYAGSAVKHTATVPLKLTYGIRASTVAVGAALAVAAVAATVVKRRKSSQRLTAEDIPDEIVLAEFDVDPAPRRKPAKKAASKKASTTKKTPAKKASAAPRKASGGGKSASRRPTRKPR